MIYHCYLGHKTNFDSLEELWVHLISIHNTLPKSKEIRNNSKVQRAMLEKVT